MVLTEKKEKKLGRNFRSYWGLSDPAHSPVYYLSDQNHTSNLGETELILSVVS